MSKTVVVVESPSKAKTINKYLGTEYKVLASYGHVRDLPSKNNSVMPDKDFEMVWELDDQGKKRMKDIITACKSCDNVLLATDPDREGEAISWHIQQILEQEKGLKKLPVKRIVFNEITKKAVVDSIKSPRDVNQELVDSYLARRALDYLVGFSISPILWRKLPGAKSAGRVQSVALRLVVEREIEIENFKTREYWSVTASCLTQKNEKFAARLTHFNSKKLDKFAISNQENANEIVSEIKNRSFDVKDIEKKQSKRNPSSPFTTSTLQQEASRKLGFSPSKTMTLAQKLYEGIDIDGETTGLITYMRTDSVNLAKDAIDESRDLIINEFGEKYLPKSPRIYKSKAKNAQEAHEAIRPTSLKRLPNQFKTRLEADQFKLYELIWSRTLASQMESALFDQVVIDIISDDKKVIFRANGSNLVFDGFLKLYQEGKDEKTDSDNEGNKDKNSKNEDDDLDSNDKLLPILNINDAIKVDQVTPNQHFTQPPARYTEASLVKKLEELGIGRPSTFVSLLQTLKDRSYVKLEKKQFRPEQRGRLVTSFLSHYFKQYIEYDFTAALEEKLDDVSGGRLKWLEVMREFWNPFNETVKTAETLKITQVLEDVEKDLENIIFDMSKPEYKTCPACKKNELHLKLSKYGAFLGCKGYPECNYVKSLESNMTTDDKLEEINDVIKIGIDPEKNVDITLRKGPYGYYLQWEEEGVKKPKRVSVPKDMDPNSITLESALKIPVFPKILGKHPSSGLDVSVSVGRFGPYVKHDKLFASIKKQYDYLNLSLEQALEILADKQSKAEQKK